METEPLVAAESGAPALPHVRAALMVSLQSVGWTFVAGSVAVALGVRNGSAVLVALGAIGFVDAVGSLALVHHFRHGVRHDELSDSLEQLAHQVVLVGLLVVGCAAVIGGAARLGTQQASEESDAAVVLSAVSLGVMVGLALRKRWVARRVASKALLSDGHLSAVGAMQAGIALGGIAAARWLHWPWADAAATIFLGGVAVAVAVVSLRAEQWIPTRLTLRWTFPRAGFAVASVIAVGDALAGERVVLIGLLVAGSALAAISVQPRATAAVALWCLALAIALGKPDGIWLTLELAVWVSVVALVGITNTVITGIVARRITRVGPTDGAHAA